MQVLLWSSYVHLKVHDATNAVREARSARVQPVVVRDAHTVNAIEPPVLALGSFDLDEVVETLRTALLHALEAEAQVYWKLAAKRLVRLEDIEPTQDRALVVGGAATDEAAILFDNQFERI